MVDTVKCQTEADLTEPFFRKLLLGAIDKIVDHQEPIAAPSTYKNYTPHPNRLTRRATAGEDRQQQNNRSSTGNYWDIDQRPAESSYHHTSDPNTATLNHPHNYHNSPHQSPRFFGGPYLGQTSEQQQPFREPPRPIVEQSFPHRLIHTSTTPVDGEGQPSLTNHHGKSSGNRWSLHGLNKR